MDQNEISKSESEIEEQPHEMMMSELLSAISETEYPTHILDAINIVREWMNDAINRSQNEPFDEIRDIFAEFFCADLDSEEEIGSLDDLYSRLSKLDEFADVIPSSKKSNDKSDLIIISLTPPDYESGLRAAIDNAAIFNRGHCRRVWIISDTFILEEIAKFIPHVEALAEQGISIRFLLVTPWGWVELPLSGATASKQQFLWRPEANRKQKEIKTENK